MERAGGAGPQAGPPRMSSGTECSTPLWSRSGQPAAAATLSQLRRTKQPVPLRKSSWDSRRQQSIYLPLSADTFGVFIEILQKIRKYIVRVNHDVCAVCSVVMETSVSEEVSPFAFLLNSAQVLFFL